MSELKEILLAEDNPNDAELTLTALSKNHILNAVSVVRDGEEALDYLYKRGVHASRKGGLPCVTLLDLKMPKVDGIEVLRKVKSDPVLRVMPIVMLTSSREERDVIETYNLGVNAYVVKPVGFTDFINAIHDLGLFWAVLNEPPKEVS